MTARRRQVKMEEETAVDRLGGLTRFLLTLLALALIFYVAAFFMVRTEGFRYMVEERLRDAWDLPVAVERVWLHPNLSLVVAGIETEGFEGRNGAGLAIDEIRLDWSVSRFLHPRRDALRRVHMRGGLFSFQQDPAGKWHPAFFHGDAVALAKWFEIQLPLETPVGTRFVREQIELVIADGALYWWNAENELVASIQGMTFESGQAVILGAVFRYTRMSADEVFSFGRSSRRVTRDLLWMGDRVVPLDARPAD